VAHATGIGCVGPPGLKGAASKQTLRVVKEFAMCALAVHSLMIVAFLM
jgi:hypothetical protein